jgi:hypothetical protein
MKDDTEPSSDKTRGDKRKSASEFVTIG